MPIDLHMHTTVSDGHARPADLVAKASEAGLRAIAVTDHDTVQGLAEALDAGERLGVRVIAGMEVSADVRDRSVHVLGYFLDLASPALARYETGRAELRKVRILAMLEKLRERGVALDPDDVFGATTSTAIGRPHVARALIARGHVKSVAEAFDRYLGTKAPCYVPYDKLEAREAAEMIREAGGVAVVAHPGLDGLYDDLSQLLAWGIAGVEVYHPDHDAGEQARFLARARDLGALVTGGSDYHGDGIREGTALGSSTCPLDDFRRLCAAAGREPLI